MDKILDLYLNELIDKKTYEQKYNELNTLYTEQLNEEKINTPKKDFTALKSQINGGILDIYSTLTNEEKRKFWNNIISKIIIDKNGIKEVIFL